MQLMRSENSVPLALKCDFFQDTATRKQRFFERQTHDLSQSRCRVFDGARLPGITALLPCTFPGYVPVRTVQALRISEQIGPFRRDGIGAAFAARYAPGVLLRGGSSRRGTTASSPQRPAVVCPARGQGVSCRSPEKPPPFAWETFILPRCVRSICPGSHSVCASSPGSALRR